MFTGTNSFTICQELEVKIMFLLNTVLKIIKTLLINNYSLNSLFITDQLLPAARRRLVI